jgi:mRNA interferase MazF
VVQADSFNASRIQSAIVAAITSNTALADAPGNVLLPARSAGLTRHSVVNVSQLLTLDRGFLTEDVGTLPPRLQRSVDEGLRMVLHLTSGAGISCRCSPRIVNTTLPPASHSCN